MKVYRLDWSDSDEGHCVAWEANRRDAEHRATTIRDDYKRQGKQPPLVVIEPEHIPIDKPNLVVWLNVHFNRDNG